MSYFNILKTIPTFFIILICSASNAFAQESDNNTVFDKKHVLYKFSPLTLMEFEPTIQVGVEYIFKPRLGFQQQLGYVFGNPHTFNNPSAHLRGIRARSDMKFYIKKTKKQRPVYLSTEVLYKFIQNYGTETFIREGGSFTQQINYKVNRNVIGFTPKFGFMNNFIKHKVVFDMAFGIGIKAVYYDNNLPADADLIRDWFLWDFSNLSKTGSEVLPNMVLSIQIGFWGGE